jgi:xanthine dehydrogenase accessory factor
VIFPVLAGVRVVVRGGGDLGSGVAYRLFVSGFPVLITELEHPLLLRRAVSFGSAIIEGSITVEAISSRRAGSIDEALLLQKQGEIPVLVDPNGDCLAAFAPEVVVDARMLKRVPDSQPRPSPLVIGLGPGFEAPTNCYAVIETNRSHHMGRVILKGTAQADTGNPEGVMGHHSDRVLRSPSKGVIKGAASIGTYLQEGDRVAQVGDQWVTAPFKGVLRGLIHDGIEVNLSDKIGDVDPRGEQLNCFTISDKALAVGGGVVEAILSSQRIRDLIAGS